MEDGNLSNIFFLLIVEIILIKRRKVKNKDFGFSMIKSKVLGCSLWDRDKTEVFLALMEKTIPLKNYKLLWLIERSSLLLDSLQKIMMNIWNHLCACLVLFKNFIFSISPPFLLKANLSLIPCCFTNPFQSSLLLPTEFIFLLLLYIARIT